MPPAIGGRCEACSHEFCSRNQLFKHLKNCGATAAAAGPGGPAPAPARPEASAAGGDSRQALNATGEAAASISKHPAFERILLRIQAISGDQTASHELRAASARHWCTSASCLCRADVLLRGHRVSAGGHLDLDAAGLDTDAIADRIAATPCSCCKVARKKASRQQARAAAAAASGALPPAVHCHGCGSTAHLERECSLGKTWQQSIDNVNPHPPTHTHTRALSRYSG